MNKTSRGISLLIFFLVFSLIGCAPVKSQEFTLRMGIVTIISNLPYYVMQDQGFARQNGLTLEESVYPGGAAVIDALAAGKLDIGIVGTVPVLSAAEKGLIPGQIVGVAANDFADADHPYAAVLASINIKTWKDLEGQTIAVNSLNSVNRPSLEGRLHLEGVKNYRLVEIPVTNGGLAVAGGNVAAAVVVEPYLTQSLLRKDGHLLGWVIGGLPYERAETVMICARTDQVQNNPLAIKAFLQSQLQAIDWINLHPDEARNILSRRMNLSTEVSKQITLPLWSVDGRNNLDLLNGIQPLMVELGMLRSPIQADRLVNETLLNEVLQKGQ